MKNLIFLVIVLFMNISFSQKRNIYVQYSVEIQEETALMNSGSEFRNLFVESMSKASDLLFGLIIENSSSKFFLESGISTPDTDGFNTTATLFSGYNGVVFQYLNNLYSESITLGRDIMVKKALKNNWKLENETKVIDDYLCYKATNVNRIDNGSGKIFNHPVTAWYCPKLPYSYGPNGYSNLPGLILELQVRNVVFGAKKIDLDSDLNFDTEFLKTVKTISEEELNKKIEEEFEELRKQYGE